MVTNDEGEITDARSLCPRIHCWFTEATVCKPRSSVDIKIGIFIT
jgi:hypothetical protein